MLYRHAHALLEVEGYERNSDAMGPTFRVRPADGDSPQQAHQYVLWSTLTTVGTGQRQSDEAKDPTIAPVRPPATVRAQLIFEVSEDGGLWVPLEPHTSADNARAVQIPFLLPFVRVRVLAAGLHYAARAVLVGAAPFSLVRKVQQGIVVGGSR